MSVEQRADLTRHDDVSRRHLFPQGSPKSRSRASCRRNTRSPRDRAFQGLQADGRRGEVTDRWRRSSASVCVEREGSCVPDAPQVSRRRMCWWADIISPTSTKPAADGVGSWSKRRLEPSSLRYAGIGEEDLGSFPFGVTSTISRRCGRSAARGRRHDRIGTESLEAGWRVYARTASR